MNNCGAAFQLKNCGATTEDDVKVSYISLDDREFPIDSQLDFQIALYSFRQRARNGNVIALKLERAPEAVKMNRSKRIRDKADRLVPKTFAAASQTITDDSSAPEWFKKYMKNVSRGRSFKAGARPVILVCFLV